ncbi:hypothetical protein [Curtobacterium citreum]|uniref:hypothetical protein n=1 Tax=Curtobacterium citreum TaxID=2036 RepID=UPI002542E341|nr:hypothetical protein [Curtobacterium citreum]WIJ45472.1 hypothetical protein QPK07_00510 [Curtobacterium citreum]
MSFRAAREGRAAVKILTDLTFSITVAGFLLASSSALFAATLDTPARPLGVPASGVAVGLSGIYVGTVARLRHARRHGDRAR